MWDVTVLKEHSFRYNLKEEKSQCILTISQISQKIKFCIDISDHILMFKLKFLKL